MVGAIKISGIPRDATQEDIIGFLAVSGPCNIVQFQSPIAIVTFEEESDAEKAVFLDRLDLLGTPILVERYHYEDLDAGYHIIPDKASEMSTEADISNISIQQAEEFKQASAKFTEIKHLEEINHAPDKPAFGSIGLTSAPKKSKTDSEKHGDFTKSKLQSVSLPARRKLDSSDPFALVLDINVVGIVTFATLVYLTLSSFWS